MNDAWTCLTVRPVPGKTATGSTEDTNRQTEIDDNTTILFDCVLPPEPSSSSAITKPTDQVLLDHKGPVRVVLQRDGSFVCEPAEEARCVCASADIVMPSFTPISVVDLCAVADGEAANRVADMTPNAQEHVRNFLLKTAECALVLSLSVGGAVGLITSAAQLEDGDVTPHQMFWCVTEAVSSSVAGVLAGLVVGPLIATKTVAKVVVRPLLLGTLVYQGVRFCRKWLNVKEVIAQLENGDLLAQLEALRKLALQVARSKRVRMAIERCGGVDAILKLLMPGADPALVDLIAKILRYLLGNPETQDTTLKKLSARHVCTMLQLGSETAAGHITAGLVPVSSHPYAQDALRAPGVIAELIKLAGGQQETARADAVKVLVNMAKNSMAASSILNYGGVPTMLSLLKAGSVCLEVKADAVTCLHHLAASCPDLALDAMLEVDDAVGTLQSVLAGAGPLWSPWKRELHDLLNTIAPLEAPQHALTSPTSPSRSPAQSSR